MEDKPNYYAVIPADVRYDLNLTDKAKLLYGEITALTKKNGYCYASNKYFSEIYSVSITTIKRLMKQLEDNNYIKREYTYRAGTKEILNRWIQLCTYHSPKITPPSHKNGLDNNTSINNTDKEEEIYKEEVFDYDWMDDNGT